MSHTAEDLEAKTVADLREIAKGIEHEAVTGYSSMKKSDLIAAILAATGGASAAPTAAAPKPKAANKKSAPLPTGDDKASLKAQVRALKAQRDAAEQAHDSVELKKVRRHIHKLKRKIRKAAA